MPWPKQAWNKLTVEQFIERARRTHGDKYDYSRVEYITAHDYIIIGCPRHGWFRQKPYAHYQGEGCRVCSEGGTLIEKFWQRVDKNGKQMPHMNTCCWGWAGTKNIYGYGIIGGKHVLAHRLSYEIHRGPIPDNKEHHTGTMFVLHKCDNPECTNPDHLFLGTALDNVEDMYQKGRDVHKNGEDSHFAILTWEQVQEARALWKAGGVTLGELGKRYGVHKATIHDAVSGKTWKEQP